MPVVRGNLKQYAIGAAGGAVASVAIVALYLVVTANARGADGGDWLAFAGVFFGVMATMLGTMWLERYKSRASERAVEGALRSAVAAFRTTLEEFPASQRKGAVVADLKQQVDFICSLGRQIEGGSTAIRLAVHAFGFHVPHMITALQREMTGMEPESVRNPRMDVIRTNMHSYAENIRLTLSKH